MKEYQFTNKEFYMLYDALRLDMQRKHLQGETVTKEVEDLYFKMNMIMPTKDE